MAAFRPGQRLSLKGALCTVRFFGEVKGKFGLWLGVEWDEAARGKSDGSHEGVRYFECRSLASPASFIKPSSPWDQPVAFEDALQRKYASRDDEIRIRISGKEVDEVGYQKIQEQQSDLESLKIAVLDCMRIRGGSPGSLPALEELDLGYNLFEELGQVSDLCRGFERLTSLVLEGNRFVPTPSPGLERITRLSLDRTLLTAEEVAKTLAWFPGLQELSCCDNQLSTVSLPSLKKVSLNGNSFRTLAVLENGPEVVQLKNNKIAYIAARSINAKVLDLAGNQIIDWEFVDGLRGVQHLILSNNPIYDSTPGLTPAEVSMMVVARLPDLQSLNHTDITDKGRLEAELFFLGRSDGGARFEELCLIHGRPTKATETTLKLVRLHFDDFSLEVPQSTSIYSLIGIVARRVGRDDVRLSLLTSAANRTIEPFDSDDEEEESLERTVILTPSTKPIGTLIEDEGRIRIEFMP